MSIDIETGLPLMGSKEGYGWLSGAAIKPLALRCIYDAARVVKIPIFGVGGIVNGRDAAEMFMVGASAVQVCTEAILRGPTVYGKIARELDAFLDGHGYNSLDEIKGLTIRRMAERGAPKAERPPDVDMGRCSLCGLCEISCPYGAISKEEVLLIDKEKCFTCGLCVSRCKRQRVGNGAVDGATRADEGEDDIRHRTSMRALRARILDRRRWTTSARRAAITTAFSMCCMTIASIRKELTSAALGCESDLSMWRYLPLLPVSGCSHHSPSAGGLDSALRRSQAGRGH